MSNDLVIWASKDVTLPVAGTANKIKPDPQLSDLGWDKGQKPSAQEFNFILNQVTSTINKINKYGAPLIGELIFWPLQQMPQEIFTDLGQVYIPYIAQAFDPVKYPLLKVLHPSGVLPTDMRGEFPRGWDNGRGVDPNRALMSAQAATIVISGDSTRDNPAIVSLQNSLDNNPNTFIRSLNSDGAPTSIPGVSAATVAAVYVEPSPASVAMYTRSRNIAWNMIVRAA